MTLTEEQWSLLKQAQEVLSHQVPDGDFSDVIAKMSEMVIKQKREVKLNATATELPAESRNPTLTARTKKIILHKDKCCTYVDPISKRKCGSRWQLEIDHLKPRWAQGTHALDNLQVLCRAHNNYKYKQQTGLA
jgi:5-methylcytosine-specific restriction endonuclease McrA